MQNLRLLHKLKFTLHNNRSPNKCNKLFKIY